MATVKRNASGKIVEFDANPPQPPVAKEQIAEVVAKDAAVKEPEFTSIIDIEYEATKRFSALSSECEKLRRSAMDEATHGIAEPTRVRDAETAAARKLLDDTISSLNKEQERAYAAARARVQSEYDIKRLAAKKAFEEVRDAATAKLRAVIDERSAVYDKVRVQADEELRQGRETIREWKVAAEKRYQEWVKEQAAKRVTAGAGPEGVQGTTGFQGAAGAAEVAAAASDKFKNQVRVAVKRRGGKGVSP